ncbi:hypoxanthine phosphoribosyltransferase [Desulfitispora alkaliphila]|uniref:hypoxanthine phosphoribosyltransferase n=1 Tax=Desulfitispora alkaliphila TaxID=622674 RepID=UPI003D199D55
MEKFVKEVLISEEEIREKTKELGQQISKDYEGKDILLLCILKGGIMFMTELSKHIDVPVEFDFMVVSSYGNELKSSGEVKIIKDLDQSIKDKHVLIVEDIIDTGLTLNYLCDYLKGRGPASIKICTLLDKPEGRENPIEVDYIGYSIPNKFVVGYGLDFEEYYRNVPYIFVPNPEEDPRKRGSK